MKTIKCILTVFAVVALSCVQTQAQNDLPYRPLKLFNKDTIRYLDYNFTIRAERYKGKPISDVIKDLELPVIYVGDFVLLLTGSKSHIVSMNLGIRMKKEVPDENIDYYIRIDLEDGIVDWDNFLEVVDSNKDEKRFFRWTSQISEFLESATIRDIRTNLLLFEDRRKVLDIDTEENRKKLKGIMKKETEQWKLKTESEKKKNVR